MVYSGGNSIYPKKVCCVFFSVIVTSSILYIHLVCCMAEFICLFTWMYSCHVSGWIHSVLTPKDSLVFGGNFLHRYKIGLQLKYVSLPEGKKEEMDSLLPSLLPSLEGVREERRSLLPFSSLSLSLSLSRSLSVTPIPPSLLLTLPPAFPPSLHRVHDMEMRLETPRRFLHPSYKALTWFAARDFLSELKGML